MSENDRPQDVGRRHRRRQAPPPAATRTVLERYQAALRDELGWLLDLLAPRDGLAGTVMREGGIPERTRRWDLAMRIAKALGGEIDPDPTGEGDADPLGDVPPPKRKAKVDYGGE